MRSGPTPLERALDEHLRLALPGWGAPLGARKTRRRRSITPSAFGEKRKAVFDSLMALDETTLHAIRPDDVVKRFKAPYVQCWRALDDARLCKTRSA
jgi:hypothetical protein